MVWMDNFTKHYALSLREVIAYFAVAKMSPLANWSDSGWNLIGTINKQRT